MTKTHRKPGQRPAHVKPPAHLSKNKPVPEPDARDKANAEEEEDSPTRYGDWYHKGIAVDF